MISRLGRILLGAVLAVVLLAHGQELKNESTEYEQSPNIIRVGMFPSDCVSYIMKDGERAGVAVEWMKRIARKNGWEIQWVDLSFDEAIQAIQDEEIDIVPSVPYQSEWADMMLYTHVITGFYRGYLFVPPSSSLHHGKGLHVLEGRSIGHVKGHTGILHLKEELSNAGIQCKYCPFNTQQELEYAFVKGSVDAVLSEVTNVLLFGKPIFARPALPTYFVINKKRTDLLKAFDLAAGITLDEEPDLNLNLRNKYYPQVFEKMARFSIEEQMRLNEIIKSGRTIMVELTPLVAPFKNYDADAKRVTGICRDILDRVSLLTGLRFQILNPDVSDAERQTRLRRGNATIWFSYGSNPSEVLGKDARYHEITAIGIPQVVCMLPNRSYKRSEKDENETIIAICRREKQRLAAYARSGVVSRIYLCDSYEECVEAVLNGDADEFISDYYTAHRTLARMGLDDKLVVQDVTDARYEPKLPVIFMTQTEPMLERILEKTFVSFSDDFIRQEMAVALEEELNAPFLTQDEIIWYASIGFAMFFFIISTITLYSRSKTMRALRHSDASLRIAEDAMKESEQAQIKMKEAVERAENAAKSKANFLATMSHEIRTPLNAVIGFADFLDKPDVPSDKQHEYARAISLSANALLSLINDILDLSKLEAGNFESIRRDETDMVRLFDEMKTIFQLKANQQNIGLDFQIDSRMPHLEIQEPRMRQILLNIIGNAVKFTEHGEVTVICNCTPNEDAGFRNLEIIVRDSGIGIAQSSLDTIFNPFTQDLESRRGKVFQGTGLGLAIVKRLIDQSNGSITVTSQLGKGSTFTIKFDKLAVKETQKRKKAVWSKLASDAATAENTKKISRVVIVDDIQLNRKILSMYLKTMGIADMLDFATVQDALAYFDNDTADLVLTDMWMPEMNGIEFTAKIKEKHPELPVVAVTADTEISSNFDTSVFASILHKPVTLPQLKELFATIEGTAS